MLTVNGKKIEFQQNQNLLSACLDAGIYIPHICWHPAIPTCEEGEGCGLCKVIVDNSPEPVNACLVPAETVQNVTTENDSILELRQKNLARILATHPHACLTCHEAEGCSRTECSQNVPVEERCCSLFGNCELQRVAAYIGIPGNTPRYRSADLPVITDQPFYNLDYNLCIACGRCLRICRDVKKVDIFTYSQDYGRLVAVPRNGSLKDSGCIFCGACVEVCPTGALMDKPWEYGGKEESVVPCRTTCPAEIDVPLYVRLIAERRYGEAVAVIREKAPIPAILGRVCYNPCETGCRRKVWDEPVAIRSLKRFAADHDDGYWKKQLLVRPSTEKKVAVVGAGPAGLSASYYLRLLGHDVDLYDLMPEPGGMLRYGIPRYRLPEDILNSEINDILDLGVKYYPGTRIESPDKLSGYDAMFWATGAPKSLSLPKGSYEERSVTDGLDFLRRINSGEKMKLSGDVAVIGGGNVATDVARCAHRVGAHRVTIIYRRTREEMPAYESEIKEALAEGVEMRFLQSPAKIVRCDNGVKVTLQTMKLGEPDNSGRRSPIPVEGKLSEELFDHVIVAIGQRVETIADFKIADNGSIMISPSSYMTSKNGVFAGGDNVTGPASVVEAVEAGRLAARAIDKHLGGDGSLPSYSIEANKEHEAADETRLPLKAAPGLRSELRSSFKEIEQGYTEEAAIAQALRCARCELRLSLPLAALPPDKYLPFDKSTIESVPDEPGVIMLYDEQKKVMSVCGSEDMRSALSSKASEGFEAAYLTFEPHQMYTQRESEILSQYLQRHGKLPAGNDMDDELF